ALRSSPDAETDGEIYVQLGQLYENRGDQHNAIANYTAALNADEANYQARRGLERLGAGG
ncbi:MAG: tetratricopeptide repeat protein, partial [Armatimonadota bacterium]